MEFFDNGSHFAVRHPRSNRLTGSSFPAGGRRAGFEIVLRRAVHAELLPFYCVLRRDFIGLVENVAVNGASYTRLAKVEVAEEFTRKVPLFAQYHQLTARLAHEACP